MNKQGKKGQTIMEFGLVLALVFIMALAILSIIHTPVAQEEIPEEDSAKSALAVGENVELDSLLTRKNYYLVFDGSGSMEHGVQAFIGPKKIDSAKKAVISFIDQLNPEDNLGLFVFDGYGTSERVPLGHENREEFINAVNAISANGGTPLYQAIQAGFQKIKVQMAKQLDYGEYHLVVITDGEASDRPGNIIEAINQTPIIIHTIGFNIGANHSLNQPGKVRYAEANNEQEILKLLSEVTAEADAFGSFGE